MNAALKLWRAFQGIAKSASEKLLALFARCEEDTRMQSVCFFVLLVIIGCIMLLLNAHTPLMMDDFDYSFSWATGERLAGIGDVMRSQAVHYRIWGGRSVVHALAQMFLYWGKGIFNVINALMYLVLLLEISALASPKEKRLSCTMLLFSHMALFFLVPFFGTAFLWLDGACNYLWGTVIALIPLLIHKKALDEGGRPFGGMAGWALLPVCFLAGWTNENTACSVFAVVCLMLIISVLEGRKVRVWQWASLAAQLLGMAVMLLAPGNYARASEVSGRPFVLEMGYRFAVVSVYALVYTAALAAVMLVLCCMLRIVGGKARTLWAALLALGAVLCAYALCASPLISDRSFTSVFVLALSAVCVLLGDLENHVRSWGGFKLPACAMAVIIIVSGGYAALSDVKAHEAAWNAQLARIETAKQEGKSAQIEGVVSVSPYTMDITISDAPDEWPNSTLSKYFGLDIIGR